MDTYLLNNGEIIKADTFALDLKNRAFRFGDSIFETIKVSNGKLLFVEKHYSRLLNSFKIIGYKIGEEFTLEYFNDNLTKLVNANKHYGLNQRLRVTFFRKSSDQIYFVRPDSTFDFIAESFPLNSNLYSMKEAEYKIEIYTDIKKNTDILASLKSNNVLLHSIAGQTIEKLGVDNVLLVNSENNIAEAANSNVFFVKGNTVFTPPTSDGCVDGVFRSNLIEIISELDSLNFIEQSINLSELTSFDEIFLSNSIIGIQSVDTYAEKRYSRELASKILKEINRKLI